MGQLNRAQRNLLRMGVLPSQVQVTFAKLGAAHRNELASNPHLTDDGFRATYQRLSADSAHRAVSRYLTDKMFARVLETRESRVGVLGQLLACNALSDDQWDEVSWLPLGEATADDIVEGTWAPQRCMPRLAVRASSKQVTKWMNRWVDHADEQTLFDVVAARPRAISIHTLVRLMLHFEHRIPQVAMRGRNNDRMVALALGVEDRDLQWDVRTSLLRERRDYDANDVLPGRSLRRAAKMLAEHPCTYPDIAADISDAFGLSPVQTWGGPLATLPDAAIDDQLVRIVDAARGYGAPEESGQLHRIVRHRPLTDAQRHRLTATVAWHLPTNSGAEQDLLEALAEGWATGLRPPDRGPAPTPGIPGEPRSPAKVPERTVAEDDIDLSEAFSARSWYAAREHVEQATLTLADTFGNDDAAWTFALLIADESYTGSMPDLIAAIRAGMT